MNKKLILSLLAAVACVTIFSCVKSYDHTVGSYTCYCNYTYMRGNQTVKTVPATFTVTSTYVAAQNTCNQSANKYNPDPGTTLYQSVSCRFE